MLPVVLAGTGPLLVIVVGHDSYQGDRWCGIAIFGPAEGFRLREDSVSH